MYTLEQLQQKTLNELKEIGWELNVIPEDDRRKRQNWIDAIAGVNPPLLQLLEVTAAVEAPAQEPPIIETVEAFPAGEVEQAQEPPIESKFGRIVYPRPASKPITFPKLTRCFNCEEEDGFIRGHWGELVECPLCDGSRWKKISEGELTGAENSPGVKVDPVQDSLPECFECCGDGYVEDAFGFIKCCSQCLPENKNEPKVSQSAIAPVAENSPAVEVDACVYCTSPEYSSLRDNSYMCYRCQPDKADLNPILTGIPLSDRFLARYRPPQSESLHYEIPDSFRVNTDGQLSLFEVQIVTEPEPPDPDDFESLDAFARWDFEHPSSSDCCSDHLPSSLHSEPPNPEDFDSMFAFWAAYDAWDKATDDNSEPLEVSLDSFCEWAPCSLDWYEPVEVSEPSEVSELSAVAKSSISSEFFIPTFDRWGDRSDRTDEPPDTGIFARLPKPKPPKFPPQASQPQVNQASRNYPETIPKQFSRVAAGSSTQPARSPPGGDA